MADKTLALGNGDVRDQRGGWRKSSHSMTNGHCLEAGILEIEFVSVRDSKAVAGLELSIKPAAWTAFVAGLRLS
jgi:hypothetical protein